MAPGGNDWLAQTLEETLEPEIPICDPHYRICSEDKDFGSDRPRPDSYSMVDGRLTPLKLDRTSLHR